MGLAAGAGPAMRRSICINQGHAPAATAQLQRGPGSEAPGTQYDGVKRFRHKLKAYR